MARNNFMIFVDEIKIIMEALKKLASPVDALGIKNAIQAAINLGFTSCTEPTEEEEVDLVLKELELNEKKKGLGAGTDLWSSLLQVASCGLAKKKPCSSHRENSAT